MMIILMTMILMITMMMMIMIKMMMVTTSIASCVSSMIMIINLILTIFNITDNDVDHHHKPHHHHLPLLWMSPGPLPRLPAGTDVDSGIVSPISKSVLCIIVCVIWVYTQHLYMYVFVVFSVLLISWDFVYSVQFCFPFQFLCQKFCNRLKFLISKAI